MNVVMYIHSLGDISESEAHDIIHYLQDYDASSTQWARDNLLPPKTQIVILNNEIGDCLLRTMPIDTLLALYRVDRHHRKFIDDRLSYEGKLFPTVISMVLDGVDETGYNNIDNYYTMSDLEIVDIYITLSSMCELEKSSSFPFTLSCAFMDFHCSPPYLETNLDYETEEEHKENVREYERSDCQLLVNLAKKIVDTDPDRQLLADVLEELKCATFPEEYLKEIEEYYSSKLVVDLA